MTLPGFDRRSAGKTVAEIGTDMSRFPTDRHLCSWAAISRGSNESAGKRKSGKTTKGSRWPKSALVQAACGQQNQETVLLRAISPTGSPARHEACLGGAGPFVADGYPSYAIDRLRV